MTSAVTESAIPSAIRLHPLVCALAACASLLQGRLRRDQSLVGRTLVMRDGRRFEVFRHVSLLPRTDRQRTDTAALLIVRFTFARLSQRANRLASLLPIPAIAGFPGFRHKVWMVDTETGCWQGVYEWADERAAEAYERSLVFRVMGRRAQAGSLSIERMAATTLGDFWRRHEH